MAREENVATLKLGALETILVFWHYKFLLIFRQK